MEKSAFQGWWMSSRYSSLVVFFISRSGQGFGRCQWSLGVAEFDAALVEQ